MKIKQVIKEILLARLYNEVLILEINDNPFENTKIEFLDFNFIQIANQIFIYNESKSILSYIEDIVVVETRETTEKNLANRLKEMPKAIINEKTETLNFIQESIKHKKSEKQIEEIKEFIKDNQDKDMNENEIYITACKNVLNQSKIERKLKDNEMENLKETILKIINEIREVSKIF